MIPPWFQIASRYPNNSGPTIPFIIGAVRDPIGSKRPPEVDRRELQDLLLDMNFKMPGQKFALIRWCDDPLHEYVVALHPNYGSPSVAKPGGFLDWDIKGENVPDVDALFSFLWERYRQPLSDQAFSFDDRHWHKFTPTELANIEVVLSGRRIDEPTAMKWKPSVK